MGRRPTLYEYLNDPDAYPEVTRQQRQMDETPVDRMMYAPPVRRGPQRIPQQPFPFPTGQRPLGPRLGPSPEEMRIARLGDTPYRGESLEHYLRQREDHPVEMESLPDLEAPQSPAKDNLVTLEGGPFVANGQLLNLAPVEPAPFMLPADLNAEWGAARERAQRGNIKRGIFGNGLSKQLLMTAKQVAGDQQAQQLGEMQGGQRVDPQTQWRVDPLTNQPVAPLALEQQMAAEEQRRLEAEIERERRTRIEPRGRGIRITRRF